LKQQEGVEINTTSSFITCTLHQILLGQKIREDGEIKIHIVLFVGIHYFRDVGTDGRIILKSLVLVNVAMNYEVPRNGKFTN